MRDRCTSSNTNGYSHQEPRRNAANICLRSKCSKRYLQEKICDVALAFTKRRNWGQLVRAGTKNRNAGSKSLKDCQSLSCLNPSSGMGFTVCLDLAGWMAGYKGVGSCGSVPGSRALSRGQSEHRFQDMWSEMAKKQTNKQM